MIIVDSLQASSTLLMEWINIGLSQPLDSGSECVTRFNSPPAWVHVPTSRD